MANGHGDMTVTQMQWQPPLLRLTHIGLADIDQGRDTICYVNPREITMLRRMDVKDPSSAYASSDATQPKIVATVVYLYGGTLVHVRESCDEVALARDRAFGIEPQLRTV